jgi:hypothetical protein
MEQQFIVTDECFWQDEKPENYNPDPKRKPHFITIVDIATGSITKLGSGSRIKIIENTYKQEVGEIA